MYLWIYIYVDIHIYQQQRLCNNGKEKLSLSQKRRVSKRDKGEHGNGGQFH